MLQTELNRRRIMAAISGDSYKAVDLGLPSGKKWANMNIGATKPEEDGLYFSWGNIEGHTADSGYNFSQSNYDNTSGAGILNRDIQLEEDAANVILGNPWRMPTKTEVEELQANTDTEWVSDFNGTGVAGRKFMKKSDHSVFIFLPASGYIQGSNIDAKGTSGFYWTTMYSSSHMAYYALMKETKISAPTTEPRFSGFSVRAIQD